jgi:predicted dehydrogenase/threonine dehydrogenase-like Zn-dependent dehydrogenase
MKQLVIKRGQVILEEVPPPQVEPGRVLVRVFHSCISRGTELAGLEASGQPLWRRALEHPEQVRQLLAAVGREGVRRTASLIRGVLEAGTPIGYSLAGEVLEVGPGVEDILPGQMVACAGAQCAHHAEIVSVPRNLLVPVPQGLDTEAASTVALGAIALQGLRRLEPTLGETFLVLGLGLLGLLAAQMLKAQGCRVLAWDPLPGRRELLCGLGMEASLLRDQEPLAEQTARCSGGVGVDGVLITASTPSHEVVSQAFRCCRAKGRVVLVGDVGLNLKRADFYAKELDFRISCSYGPGRYDPRYEEQGQDYPLPYVRWTENRNMAHYLDMLAGGEVRLEGLLGESYPLQQAAEAYRALQAAEAPPLVLLSYPVEKPPPLERRVPTARVRAVPRDRVRLALVGAGAFAKGMHLPNLQRLQSRFHLRAVVSRSGHNATATARRYQADYATTDYQEVLNDPEVDAVLICTRHHLHAAQALAALQAGKHVLVEKPLALSREELDSLTGFYRTAKGEAPLCLTGFNRRFSPLVLRLKKWLREREHPVMLRYLMNAGHLPRNHWVHSGEGGGRNLGEACHVYDLFRFLVGAPWRTVHLQTLRPREGYYTHQDNFVVTVSFGDGSLASLTYTAAGHASYPKERLEVLWEGKVAELVDFRSLQIYGGSGRAHRLPRADKGHLAELEAFAQAVLEGGDWPIPWSEQVEVTTLALAAEEQMRKEESGERQSDATTVGQ